MKLTQYSDLGLRLLIYLALRHGKTATIQEASDRFAVSRNHMVKISHQLTKAGLIESTRGRNDGVCLARPPESITVEEAVRATEDNFDLVECFSSTQNECVISGICKLKGVLYSARTAFFKELRQVSLADLVKNSGALENSLLPFPIKIRVESITQSTTALKRTGT